MLDGDFEFLAVIGARDGALILEVTDELDAG